MPELPEVETIKQQLQMTVVGKKISEIKVDNTKVLKEIKPEDFINGLKDVAINGVIRKGKLLIMELSSGKSLTIHLKLTGQLIYPSKGQNSRVSFKLSDNNWLDYNDSRLLGELRLVDDWRSLDFIKKLGPEPFNLSLDIFKMMLSHKTTKIKPLLMDQSFISGIGNLYAAEILFKARIHPERSASSLSCEEKEMLFKEMINVLNEAIAYKGSSVDQYVQLSGDRGDYIKLLKVYDREGRACFNCNNPIERITLAGRGTYFCPQCQKR